MNYLKGPSAIFEDSFANFSTKSYWNSSRDSSRIAPAISYDIHSTISPEVSLGIAPVNSFNKIIKFLRLFIQEVLSSFFKTLSDNFSTFSSNFYFRSSLATAWRVLLAFFMISLWGILRKCFIGIWWLFSHSFL